MTHQNPFGSFQSRPVDPTRPSHAPHRGQRVLLFGISALVIGVLGAPLCLGLPGFFGVGFGIAAWRMGRTDLKRMDDGLVDPAGRRDTEIGKLLGALGAGGGLLATLFFIAMVVFQTIAMVAAG